MYKEILIKGNIETSKKEIKKRKEEVKRKKRLEKTYQPYVTKCKNCRTTFIYNYNSFDFSFFLDSKIKTKSVRCPLCGEVTKHYPINNFTRKYKKDLKGSGE